MIDIQHIKDMFRSINRTARYINKALAREMFEFEWRAERQDRLEAERLSPPGLAFAIGVSYRTL